MVFHGYGLQVLTPGEILLDGVTANDNNLWGASLNGSKITVINSTFNNNKETGLSITTSGPVTLTNVTANNNGLNGVDIIGSCTTTTVAVSNGEYSDNGNYGIKAASATVSLIGSPIFVNNPNLFDGCPGVTPITIMTTTDPVGGNVPLDVQPTDTTTVTNDVVVENVVALQNTSANTDTANHPRNHGRDNRYYSAALQICKWCNHFRGNLFSYLFFGNYYGHHRH
jgi:hypothetical protein